MQGRRTCREFSKSLGGCLLLGDLRKVVGRLQKALDALRTLCKAMATQPSIQSAPCSLRKMILGPKCFHRCPAHSGKTLEECLPELWEGRAHAHRHGAHQRTRVGFRTTETPQSKKTRLHPAPKVTGKVRPSSPAAP